MQLVKQTCEAYVEGFGSPATGLCYHHRLNGPAGLGALSAPEEIARGQVRGKDMPYGYGSGIQDVALENGQFLFALCDAVDATHDPDLAAVARRIFSGMKRVARVSPVPGFVPRGPHPDGKSYYRDSSRDQHCAFVEAMWRYARGPLATDADRTFIARVLEDVTARLEANNWIIKVEDGSRMAHVGFGWRQHTMVGAVSLLMVLAATADVTGNSHWRELYNKLGGEADAVRWKLLDPREPPHWPPFTLYTNQFAQSLAVLKDAEPDPTRKGRLNGYLRAMAERALRTNVFDKTCWRRLDWAGNRDDAETERLLRTFGLSLSRSTTVRDLFRVYDPKFLTLRDARRRGMANKLLFGIPTVAYHIVLLSRDPTLVSAISPDVEAMVRIMHDFGAAYNRGENFNRTVVLGLELLRCKKQ
ncbi:MAG: hypothetical protein GXP31_08775 [Kiritimatiellaeota bacterium]|nr:hypothetical protein [Kiritimatiellota bacterium]